MDYKEIKITLVIMLVLILELSFGIGNSPTSFAYVMSSPNYRIQKDSLNVGGLPENSSNYKMWESIGEIATGKLTSSNYNLIAGYQAYVPPILTFSISNNSIGFGTLTTGTIYYATADGNGSTSEPGPDLPVKLTVSTNAENGVVITVKDSNGGLSMGSYTIPGVASSSVSTSSEGYGVYGKDASGLTIDEGFDNDGTSDVAISTSYQTFASSTSYVSSADVDLAAKTAIVATTAAGSYSDTITVIATGRF